MEMELRKQTRDWQAVDSASDPQAFVQYLERLSEHPTMRRHNCARLAAAQVAAGSIVLDLGCGIGSDALMLAEAVGTTGQVHAMDRSRLMVETTARRATEHGVTIACKEADAGALPYPDRTFDLVWLERVLMHVGSPLDTLREIRRVLQDGGQLVVFEPDSDALMVSDGGDADLACRLEQRWSDGIAHPRMGRALERLARVAGFTDIRTEPRLFATSDFDLASSGMRWPEMLNSLVTSGDVSESRAQGWYQAVGAEARSGLPICWLPCFELFARR
jgi:ubiquinone/menaquinone biosynthesis C-methylase UbiE